MALIDSIVIRYIRFLTVVMYSSQLSNYQLLKCCPMVISREAFLS